MIQVRIASLSVDASTNQPVIILQALDDERFEGTVLPIWIGQPEATAILLALQDIVTPRPLTHDLLNNVLATLGATCQRVEVTRLEEGTFYAAILVQAAGHELEIDARPSDSIALAVRCGAPIFVADSVMEAASVPIPKGVDEDEEVERFREFLDQVDPSDFS